MEKLHHTIRKSAVKQYGGLVAEGKTEDEIKTILASDERKWAPEHIDEIYEALTTTQKEDDENASYVVVSEFRDRNDFSKVHEKDAEFEHSDKELIASLVERGLIEKA